MIPTLLTLAEQSSFTQTGRIDEVDRLCAAMSATWPDAAASFEYGESAEGRPLRALILSRSGARSAMDLHEHERVGSWNRPNQNGPQITGWRTTAQNLNLNRDYTKADAPICMSRTGRISSPTFPCRSNPPIKGIRNYARAASSCATK